MKMTISKESSETCVRSDLWPTMTIAELANQQDIVITRISTLSKIMSTGANPTYHQIYSTLQVALADLTKLIEYRSIKQK